MSLVLKIAKRFVFDSHTKRSDENSSGFVSFIASISILGLSLGVTALLVVTSVMNGFEHQLASTLTAFHGHILFFSRSEPIGNPEKLQAEIQNGFKDIVAVSPYIFGEVMVSSSHGVAGSVVEGIDLPTVSKVSQITSKVISGRIPELKKNPPEIGLGDELARKLAVQVGDTVLLTVPFAGSGDTPLVYKLKVSGILKYGMFDYDSKYTVMVIEDLQRILSLDKKINAFKILTKDSSTSLKTTTALNERFSYPLRAKDWSSLNRNLFYAIRLEKVVISIILLSIILVASFNIISTIMMIVHDKSPQVSMLKAMGWNQKQTFAVFLLIGASLSVLGTFLGLIFGRLICGLVAWKSIIDLPADIYMFNRLPVEIRPIEWVLISVGTILIALSSTLIPSRQVSKQDSIEGLRNG